MEPRATLVLTPYNWPAKLAFMYLLRLIPAIWNTSSDWGLKELWTTKATDSRIRSLAWMLCLIRSEEIRSRDRFIRSSQVEFWFLWCLLFPKHCESVMAFEQR